MTESVKFNDVGDILYVRLREGRVATTKAFGDDRLVDLDQDGQVLGVEFIGIEHEIDLRGLPEQPLLCRSLALEEVADFAVVSDDRGASIAASD